MSYGSTVVRKLLFLTLVLCLFGAGLVISLVIESSIHTYENTNHHLTQGQIAFPMGIDPQNAVMVEQADVNAFFNTELAEASEIDNSWWNWLADQLQTNHTWQQIASPVSRVIVVWPGERTEEVAESVGDILRWSQADRAEFISIMQQTEPGLTEGTVLPGRYLMHRGATPVDIATLLQETFQQHVKNRYTDEMSESLSLADTLIIASLIEREASDFVNKREVSGVIWNRIFIDMPLQLDASLQYVKANNPGEPWWPVVRSADKFLDSPYNTYQNKGLPPGPIANPSLESIVAALNPKPTECIFYFHSATGDYYCSKTYQQHVSKLRAVYK